MSMFDSDAMVNLKSDMQHYEALAEYFKSIGCDRYKRLSRIAGYLKELIEIKEKMELLEDDWK